ncbi:MAG: methyltransferase [Crocinitomicaceae bacterium]|nr:methyltransferase [Crocinitomicaceae bacterium]
MSKPFKFKQFELVQERNAQKIGTDSMLLGAWTSEIAENQDRFTVSRILDIGTGTGILALMMAQKFPGAEITAIESDKDFLEEAAQNFMRSSFSSRILPIHTRLQDFGSIEKFDLIICNPPYYNGSYLSENNARNQARHRDDLPVHELYECAFDLLSEYGRINLVVPHAELNDHIHSMTANDLYLDQVLQTKKASGENVRTCLSLWKYDKEPEVNTLIVKDATNKYSPEYIALTRDFYYKDLSKY